MWASALPTMLLSWITFTLGNSIFIVIYYLEIPFFEQYKISNKPWPWKTSSRKAFFEKINLSAKILAFNNFVVGPISVTLAVKLYKYELGTTIEEMPSFLGHILQIMFMILCEDFMSYWSHRIIHHPYLYKKFHYIHHMYNENLSFAS